MHITTVPEHLVTYQQETQDFMAHSLCPKLQRLENEASAEMKEHLAASNVNYQLALPHIH